MMPADDGCSSAETEQTTMNEDRKSNGASKQYVLALARATRDAIDAAYAAAEAIAEGCNDGAARQLYDYARDKGHTDKFERMIDREKANERDHRRFGASFTRGAAEYGISVAQAATVLVLGNIGDGAKRTEPVTAEQFMTLRPGCAEAMQIGYLARVQLAPLVDQLCALDYAAAVK
jgi:hypothetical protein